tara:strand:- start:242 stop:1648 length:1407 start_codon:yes stop_codon:yes gene_type:complete
MEVLEMTDVNDVIKARARLMRKDIGIASMLLSLELVESTQHDTMATDGERIFYNPEWVATISPEEIEAVLIHEALHVVFEHPCRRGNRNHKLFNIACDYVINAYIVYDLGLSLPEGGLLDRKYHGMTAEQVYRILDTNDDAFEEAMQQAKASNGDGDGDSESQSSGGDTSEDSDDSETEEESLTGKYSCDQDEESDSTESKQSGNGSSKYDEIPKLVGEVLDGADEEGNVKTQVELEELADSIRSKIFLADKVASLTGTSSMRGAVNDVKKVHIDWIDKVREFLTGASEKQSSWNRLNKRHSWRGVNLPTQIGVASGGEIAIAIDTSCSVSQPELDYIGGAVQLICEDLGIERVRVCYCDTRVHKNSQGEWWDIFELSQGEDIEFELRGGGGTDFDPPFNLFNDFSDDVDDVSAFIYFTDGFGEVNAHLEPDVPVFWGITHERRYYPPSTEDIPFGEICPVDISGMHS